MIKQWGVSMSIDVKAPPAADRVPVRSRSLSLEGAIGGSGPQAIQFCGKGCPIGTAFIEGDQTVSS